MCALISACAQPDVPRISTGEKITPERLTAELKDFGSFFEITVKQASSDLDEALGDKQTRRATLRWRLRMIPACRMVLEQDDPRRAFLDAWGLSTRMRQYLTIGEGKTLFREHQQIAIEASQRIEEEIERVGRMFLEPANLAAADKQVDQFSERFPIHGVFSGVPVRMASESATTFSAFAKVIGSPLQVISGVDRTAQAIRGFTHVADRFATITTTLPESTRWQVELLLIELEDNPVVSRLLEQAQEVTQIRIALEKLPQSIREESERLMDQLDQRQSALQETLERAEKTAATVERALERVDVVAQSVEQTAKSTADAGRAWGDAAKTIGETVQSFRKDEEPAARPATTQPGIEEYRRTIEEVNRTAGELQRLAMDVREMVDSQALAERIGDVDRTLNSTIDRAVRGLAVLIVLAFVLAIVYRIAAARISKKAQ